MTAADTARETVADAFARALDVPTIDWDTGFFDLGADSKTIVRVVVDLRERWPFLRVTDVFAHPTVSDLATYLTATHP